MSTTDLSVSLPDDLANKVRERLSVFREQEVVRRIWDRDTSVWSGADEDRWLGWLTLPMQERNDLAPVLGFANEINTEGITDVVLLGMGARCARGHALDHRPLRGLSEPARGRLYGSGRDSLGGTGNRYPPDDLSRSVKIGIDARGEYPQAAFLSPRGAAVRRGRSGAALRVDDGSRVEARADREAGRLPRELALAGRDKPTLIAPPGLASFGAWLEQLVAESLGKLGKGIIPVEGEVAGPPDVYGRDRVFVHLRAAGATDAAAEAAIERLERAGHPLMRSNGPIGTRLAPNSIDGSSRRLSPGLCSG